MPKVELLKADGGAAGSVDLDDAVFGIEPNTAVMHQVVTAQLANRRSGTQSTKTRAEVRGGGAKPWRQKGTGRARQGSIRSPQWRGGGVALGPKPRSYAQRTPKKMKRLALRSALSDRAAQERVLVVDEWSFETPRTKDALAALSSLDLEGRILLVLGDDEVNAAKSFRNLQEVHTVRASELNTYDVLVSDWVVFSKATVPAPEPAAPAPTPEAAVETAEPEQAEEEEAETAVTTDDAVDGDEPESTENETDEEES
jgi:large subunit ribosomal protein L4